METCEHRFGTISTGNVPDKIVCGECDEEWPVTRRPTHEIVRDLVNVVVSPDEPQERDQANSWYRMRMDLWQRFKQALEA